MAPRWGSPHESPPQKKMRAPIRDSDGGSNRKNKKHISTNIIKSISANINMINKYHQII